MATKTLYEQFKCITCKLCVDMGRPADLYDVEMYKEHYRDAHCKDVRMYSCVACGPSSSFASPCHAIHHLKRKCKQSVPIVTAANPNQDAFAVTRMHIIDWDGMKDMQDAVNHGIREALKREYERGLAVGRAEQASSTAPSAPSAPPSLPASFINHQRPDSASETASEAASTAPFSKKQTARRPKRPRHEREREEKRRKMEFGYINVKREAVTPEPVEQPLPSSLDQETQTDSELKEQAMQTDEKEQFDQIIQTEQEQKEQITQTEKEQSPEQMTQTEQEKKEQITQTEQEQKEQCVQMEKEEKKEERPAEEAEAKDDWGLQCFAWCGDIQQSSPVVMPPRQNKTAPAPAPAPAPPAAPPAAQMEQTMEEVFEQMEAEAKMRRREKKQKALTAEELLERELDMTGPVIQNKNTIRRGKKHDPAVELLLEREVMGVVEEEKEKEEGDENMETEMDSEFEQVEREMDQKAREKIRQKRRELRRTLPVDHTPTSAFQPLKMRLEVRVGEECVTAPATRITPATPVYSRWSAASTPRTPSHSSSTFAPFASPPSIDCGFSSAASEASPAYEREEEGQGDPRLTARGYQKRTCASVQLRSQRDRKKADLRRRMSEEGIEFQEFIRQIRPIYTLEKHIVSNDLQELEKWLETDRGREEIKREVSRKRDALSACRSFEDDHCLVCDGGHALHLFERSLLVPYTFDDGRMPLRRGITVRPVHHQDMILPRDMPIPPPTPRSPVSSLPPPPKRFA